MSTGRMGWSMLLGSSLLALSAAGCNDNGRPMSADMLPAGQPTATAGSMAASVAGNTTQTAGSAGTSLAAGASAASAGTSGSVVAGSAAAGSGATAGGSAAGTGGDTAGTTAGASGGGAAGSAGGAGSSVTPMHEDLGKGDGRDVVLMGDSWMSNTLALTGTGGGISPSLRRLSGQPYRNYAVQGVMLLSADLFGPAIPTQWDSAKRAGSDIKTVVMTGGGNDVIQNPGLQADCEMNGEQCKQFRMQIVAALDKLWTQMADDGVEDIIYVRYAASAGSGSMMPPMDPPAPPAICTSGKVRCHSLDTTALVNGELAGDGIHPLASANDRIAQALVDMMAAKGIRR
jgi:hypothetical protein